jgi:hypothetical protein
MDRDTESKVSVFLKISIGPPRMKEKCVSPAHVTNYAFSWLYQVKILLRYRADRDSFIDWIHR